MRRVTVKAPAKLNLSLAVRGLTDAGYHTMDMVMQAVDVWETVDIAKSDGYSLQLPGSPVPPNEKNTATKAAKVFFTELGPLAGCSIVVHKTVPTRAGLAGGSADAAAVLLGLNELYGARLSTAELCHLGLAVGADVPFSLLGGTARVSGIGDVLAPLPPLPDCWFSIAMPAGGVSTPAAFARFDEVGSPLSPNLDAAEAAICAGDLAALAPQMQNMLEHASGNKTTALLRGIMDAHGALASAMTGSGAAVFGLFSHRQKAEAASTAARPHAVKVFTARPVSHGAAVTCKD